jgi:hypothetical protein
MKSWFRWFNIYLALAGVFLAPGCSSDNPAGIHGKKELSTIRLYLEENRADTTSTGTVLVTRAQFPMVIDREPFLTEADLSKAMLIDDPGPDGSYAIQLLFDSHGTLLLDMTTTANKGRHIVVFSQFPKPGFKSPKAQRRPHSSDDDDMGEEQPPEAQPTAPNEPRQAAWLAAVLIRGRNANGMFRFTPDASHEEGARIVRGLKNVIAANKRKDKF